MGVILTPEIDAIAVQQLRSTYMLRAASDAYDANPAATIPAH
jgi:hypothetical protein